MKLIDNELSNYRRFIAGITSSENVLLMYCRRAKRFLECHPKAMELDEEATRSLIDGYIEDCPINSAKEVLATAVRYYWSYRFGKPYLKRYRPCDYPPNDSIAEELDAFKAFLTKTKNLKDVTIAGRVRDIGRFLKTVFGATRFARDAITVEVVRSYLADSTDNLKLSTKSRFAGDIRSYSAFLVETGHRDTAYPIMKLPLSFNSRRRIDIPGRIDDADLRVLIESIDSSCERGARDLALVLLMGSLGLRRSEVAHMELKDVDWSEGVIFVRHTKSKVSRRLPLTAAAGAAVERYVTEFRPKTDNRRIFMVAGGEKGDGPMSPAQAGCAVKLAAEKAGLNYHGTHTLRRAVFTDMVASGVSIKVVADIAGHEDISTTMGYLRLDLTSLREVAAEWPGEVRHG
jgi:site-specific recombinase XerD